MKNKIFLGNTLEPELESMINRLVDIPFTKKISESVDCNIFLYIIANNNYDMVTIAKAVTASHNKSIWTIFHVIPDDMSIEQLLDFKIIVNLMTDQNSIAYIDSDIIKTISLIQNIFIT